MLSVYCEHNSFSLGGVGSGGDWLLNIIFVRFLFYPTLVYAYFDEKKGEVEEYLEREVGADGDQDDRTALLRG